MSLDVVIMDRARFPTRTLIHSTEKTGRVRELKFGEWLQLPLKFVGKIHFCSILYFGHSMTPNVDVQRTKRLVEQGNEDWKIFRSNFGKMNFSDKLQIKTKRILLELGQKLVWCSLWSGSKFSSPH